MANQNQLAALGQVVVGDDAVADAVGLNSADEEQFTVGRGEQVSDVQDALPEMDNWEERAPEHLMDLQTGLDALGTEVESDEEKKEFFQLKRDIVLALVEKVLIGKDREMKVIFKLDVLSLLGIDINSTSSGKGKTSSSQLAATKVDGIYNRKRSSLLRRRYAAYG